MLFVFESRETGEYEPNLEGDPVPIFEMDLHQYADMTALKKNLSSEHYDIVRNALGLEPLAEAVGKGTNITNTIRNNLNT